MMPEIIKNHPYVSVILPVRNEFANIEKGLRALLVQDYPTDQVEILVVDGMSTDDTRKAIHDFSLQHLQLNIHILDNHGMIVPTGMNIALRQAKGKIIIRIDGHTLIAPDYVRQCVDALQRTKADNVGGKMNAIGGNPFGRVVTVATSTPFGIGNSRFHYSNDEEWVDTVYMGAWHRRVFDNIGLFDEELVRNQDDEFNYRLSSRGGKVLLSPKIRSEYTVRGSPLALWRQYYQYGLYKVRVLQKHPLQMSLRQFVPPAFVLALLVSALFELPLFSYFHPSPFILHPLPLILFSYLSANLAASTLTISRIQKSNQSPFTIYYLLLPFVFAILHISYGFGFLAGLFKFWNRWGDKTGRTPAFSNSSHE